VKPFEGFIIRPRTLARTEFPSSATSRKLLIGVRARKLFRLARKHGHL
jgi:hypothetical protein